jgi:hypothetical protein
MDEGDEDGDSDDLKEPVDTNFKAQAEKKTEPKADKSEKVKAVVSQKSTIE